MLSVVSRVIFYHAHPLAHSHWKNRSSFLVERGQSLCEESWTHQLSDFFVFTPIPIPSPPDWWEIPQVLTIAVSPPVGLSMTGKSRDVSPSFLPIRPDCGQGV